MGSLARLGYDYSQCAPGFSNPNQKVHGLFHFYIAGIYETDQNQLKKTSVIRFPKITSINMAGKCHQQASYSYRKSVFWGLLFWNPDDRWFFQLILICLMYTCNIKVKKSMDFLVWFGKNRNTLCSVIEIFINLHYVHFLLPNEEELSWLLLVHLHYHR